MILEVSQYLENYLWPYFDPETATFEHVMSMILMINEKVALIPIFLIFMCLHLSTFSIFIHFSCLLKIENLSVSFGGYGYDLD